MKPLQKIVILGGGTTGWMCAAMLANSVNTKRINIELVESEQIGTIGVGESTVPPFMDMLASLGIDEVEFIQATQATFKLGIQFKDWLKKGETFFHPFGRAEAGMDELSLYHLWLRAQLSGDTFSRFLDYSPNSVMAQQKRFAPYKAVPGTLLADSRYALHLDAGLVAKYLRNFAQPKGVKRTEGKVEKVNTSTDTAPRILSLQLDSGQTINGDFFIDCSGFRALLIGDALQSSFTDWSTYLPCNRAVTVQSEALPELPPYTKATAQLAGWQWRIPLQHRTGNGYVYASKYISDEQATQTLLSNVQGKTLTEPRIIPFTTGMRKQVWKANCIGVGLAAGFIEPLESTAIHLAMRGIAEFLQQFPHGDCNPALINEYNARLQQDYEEIRDFIILHYAATERNDSDFWAYCKNVEWPASLVQTVEYFKARGDVPRKLAPLFESTSWRSLCEGMNIRPSAYSAFIENADYKASKQHMQNYKQQLVSLVNQIPTHKAFIEQNCASSSK